MTAIMFVASAWLAWRLASVVAEAIVASPVVGSESLHANDQAPSNDGFRADCGHYESLCLTDRGWSKGA